MGEKLLYWGSGSIPCWKPMIVLAEKNIEYTSKQISFSEKGHKGPDVMALNPRGQVRNRLAKILRSSHLYVVFMMVC